MRDDEGIDIGGALAGCDKPLGDARAAVDKDRRFTCRHEMSWPRTDRRGDRTARAKESEGEHEEPLGENTYGSNDRLETLGVAKPDPAKAYLTITSMSRS